MARGSEPILRGAKNRVKPSKSNPLGQLYHSRYDDPTAPKRRQLWTPGFATKDGVRRWLRNHVLNAIDEGTYVDPAAGRITLAAYFEQTLDPAMAPDSVLSENTLLLYRSTFKNWIAPYVGPQPLSWFTRQRIIEYYAAARRDGITISTEKIVNRVLSRTFSRATDVDELLPRNPYTRIPLRQAESAPKVKLEPAQIDQLAAAIEPQYRAALLLMGKVGLRGSEAAGLQWQDLDLEAGELRIERALVTVNGKLLVRPPKTRASRRVISLPPSLVTALREHRLLTGSLPVPGAHVFTAPEGGWMSPALFNARQLKRACEKAGLPRVTMHSLRHSAITNAISAGLHPQEIKTLAGHGSIQQTMDVYGSLFPSQRREAADKLEAYYGGAQDA